MRLLTNIVNKILTRDLLGEQKKTTAIETMFEKSKFQT